MSGNVATNARRIFGQPARLATTRRVNRLRAGLLGLNNQVSLRAAAIRAYDEDGKLIPKAMGLADHSEPFDSQILIRGEGRQRDQGAGLPWICPGDPHR